ncbi:hypothetical protein HID58_031504 [Brassica napus]|uniref:S-protein homolog n=1 Tax=Brassica napus TaxID=3708 RepID=A0ABQ8BUZ4_BRANA|nr:hypothetical protein HID58_031504 [Brassica napus]
MKTVKIHRLIISLLLVAAITASGEKEAVLDFLGRPVLFGEQYLIRVDYGKFIDIVEEGWINHAGVPLSACPEYVSINGDIPDYVTFDSLSSSYLQVLRVSTEINIYFPWRKRHCDLTLSGYWKAKGGLVGLSGSEFHNDSFFTIEKYNGSYRLAFKGAEIVARLHGANTLILTSEVPPPPMYYRRFNVSFVR